MYNQNGGAETTHDFQKEGTWSWGIRINVDDCDEALVVKEKLPADVTLQDPLKINAGQWREFRFNGENQASVTIDSDNNHWVVTAEKKEDGLIEIQIPQEVVAYVKKSQESSHNILLQISVKLDDDAIWMDKENGYECVRLKNQVTVTTKSGTEIGRGEQTQTINKKKENNIIKKTMTGDKDNTGCVHNIIPYSITINPEAKDLLEGTDTLKLNDTINLYDRNNISLSLIQDSVKVYHVNSDGSKGEPLAPMEYPYTYNVKRGPDFNNPSKIYSLSIQIPDSQALIVEYEYTVSGSNGTTVYGISNSATLEGVSEASNGDKVEANVKIVDSDAEANLNGVILRKVDADNNGIILPGAEFELYVWNSQEYVPVLDTNSGTTKRFITNSKGEFEMTKLAYNTAYKLVEVKAPDGYSQNKNPYYFLIKDSNLNEHPVYKPDEFEGEELDVGSYILYPNTKNTTDILVKKVWRDSNGKDITSETAGSIQFELWKHAEVGKGNGVPLSCYIEYGWNTGVWQEFKTSDYSVGTELEFSLTDCYNQYFGSNKPKIWFNNEEVKPIKEPKDTNDKPYIYTYRIVLKDGTNKLTGTVNRNNQNDDHWAFSGLTVVSTPQSGTVELPQDERVLYTLTKEAGWQMVINNLPKNDVLNNADKTPITYTYYVREVPVQNCTTGVSKNDNNSYQIFTITNIKHDNPAYELPETGGIGTTPYTMAGIVLIAIAFLLYINKKIIIKK